MKLAIYIPDATYDQGGPENASEIFKEELEREYKQKSEYVDIGAGASWPAFLFVIVAGPYLASGLALFFMGKEIEENFDAWLSMAKRIAKFVHHRPIFDRQAAAILAVAAVMNKHGGLPKSIKLNGFRTTNTRDMEEHELGTKIEGIEKDDPDLRRLDGIGYWFDIESDGKLFQVWVEWDKPPHIKE